MCHGNHQRLPSLDACDQTSESVVLVVDADFREVDLKQMLDLFFRCQYFGSTAQNVQAFLVDTGTVKQDVLVVVKFLLGGDRDGNGVANGYCCLLYTSRCV